MPRKKNVPDTTSVKKPNKKNIIDTMIKTSNNEPLDENDDIIIQLPIPQNKINSIINNNDTQEAKIANPAPYETKIGRAHV